MRLTSFSAHNFRSLIDVRLEDLGEVVWLHGENNAGKSNLLRAIGVWLRAIRRLARRGTLSSGRELVLTPGDEELDPGDWLGRPYQSQFRHGQRKLRLGGTLAEDVRSEEAGEEPPAPRPRTLRCELELVLRRAPNEGSTESSQVVLTVVSLTGTDEEVISAALPDGPERWLHILAERRFQDEVLGDGITLAAEPAGDGGDLKQRLFNAYTGTERSAYERFTQRFAPLVRNSPFQLGEPRPVQDLKTKELDLQLDGESVMNQGSGPRQWVLLAAFLAMSQADIVAIEEPEANLSWDAQERVAVSLLAALREARYQVRQLFISSHSRIMHRLSAQLPWFEVLKDAAGTRVQRWQGEEGLDKLFPPDPPGAPPHEKLMLYSGNVFVLPTSIVQHLRLRAGDYAMPCRNPDGTVTLIGEEDFTARERAAANPVGADTDE